MSSSTSAKTALITGGCSGIGLALVNHLLAKTETKWNVIIADINEKVYPSISQDFDSSRTTFIHCDVSSWDSHAALFKKAFEWAPNKRIDFFAANAGIADKERIIGGEYDLDIEPQKPNLQCLDVDIYGVLYGLKLFVYYTRKAKKSSSETFHPKMVITASCVGQYPFAVAPQYAAAKAACVNLTRSVGLPALRHEGIAVNCIMPAFVLTNIMPEYLATNWPKEYVTPLGTMMRAYDELIEVDGKVVADGISDGVDGTVKTAMSVECVVDKLFYRTHVPPPDGSQEYMVREATEDGIWGRGLKDHTEQMMKQAMSAK
jgi:15-hydroxyprostaglandin dehydrogenase (NAD)